jgi:hypothetical protein
MTWDRLPVGGRRGLVALLGLQVAAIALLYGFFVRTAIGHRIGDPAPAWSPGWSMVLPWLDELLHLVAVLSLIASAVVLLVGLIRRGLRFALMAAVGRDADHGLREYADLDA